MLRSAVTSSGTYLTTHSALLLPTLMYNSSHNGMNGSHPSQNAPYQQNDLDFTMNAAANDIQQARLRRTRSTNPFDYDPYDRSNDSPPPPVPPRPHALQRTAISTPTPQTTETAAFLERPTTATIGGSVSGSYHSQGYQSPPPGGMRPFPRQSDSDLSVPGSSSSASSSNRPSPSHYPSSSSVSSSPAPFSPPSYEYEYFPSQNPSSASAVHPTTNSNTNNPNYEYFNNPWAHPPEAHSVRPGQPGVYTGGLTPMAPGEFARMRQRAKSSVDLRSANAAGASAAAGGVAGGATGGGVDGGAAGGVAGVGAGGGAGGMGMGMGGAIPPRVPKVSMFVKPTMSFPMPEIPSFGVVGAGGGEPEGFYAPPVQAQLQQQPHLGRATSAHASLVNNGANKSLPPSPPRPHARNSVPNPHQNNHVTTPPPPLPSIPSSSSSSSSPTPTPPANDSGSKTRRPSSSSSGSRARGEFRFSPNLMKLQSVSASSVRSTATTTTTNSSEFTSFGFGDSERRNGEEYEDGFSSPTDHNFSTESLHFDSEEYATIVDKQLSSLSLDMDENVTRFQNGELPEQDQEWHRLVPAEALSALDSTEIKRQGLIFELLKAEREYVSDLETMDEVFVKGITESDPPVVQGDEGARKKWVEEVFGNLGEILGYHREMLKRLFERQREGHPLIHSIADIILDKEMLKRTDKDHGHQDVDLLPIIRDIVSSCIKATQPGIETAEQKVKFWELCENIIFQRGEITDMDLYNKERHLVYMGPVWRKVRAENSFSSDKWQEATAHLLDNYFILTRDVKSPNGTLRKIVISRPLPLSFVRLAAFNNQPETRREKVETGSLLDTFRSQDVALYPFTLYHASPTLMKAYTLYTTTEGLRKKWNTSFVDALTVHKVQQENNQMFAQETLVDGFFRIPKEPITPAMKHASGRITAAVPFATQNGQRYLAVGCAQGIFIAPYGKAKGELNLFRKGCSELKRTLDMKRVFTFPNPHYLAALQSVGDRVFNRFIIHTDTRIISYSLELAARFVTGKVEPSVLEASKENVTTADHNVLFVRHCILQDAFYVSYLMLQCFAVGQELKFDGLVVIYASKKRLSTSVGIHILEAVAHSVQRPGSGAPTSFRPFGKPASLPKEAYDIVALHKTINVCTKSGLVSGHADNFSTTAAPPVPLFHGDSSSNPPMNLLKNLVEHARPLGIVKTNNSEELLVVYDDLGVYINGRGQVVRKYGYLKWETKATSYAHRSGLILLISPRFIEIREVSTGRLVQVIEGGDIRLLYSEPEITPHDNILVAMRGKFNDGGGLSEKIVELFKTVEYGSQREPTPVATPNGTPGTPGVSVWSEWDMGA
ncbi:hypothetical protein NMY22_g13650 [Coprinellus aureogranulatus]|nr:hypothetical protein NMY22_g13650 [Coprinellus aureogranulatus]